MGYRILLSLILLNFLHITYAKEISKIPKGTILTCPKDNKAVLRLKQDITLFDNLSWDKFVFLEKYPKFLDKKIPCDVIKANCFHIDNRWVGFSEECSLIPYNSGRTTFQEFIENELQQYSFRQQIKLNNYQCIIYDKARDVSICYSKDNKIRCLKSKEYKTKDNLGPCTDQAEKIDLNNEMR